MGLPDPRELAAAPGAAGVSASCRQRAPNGVGNSLEVRRG